MNIFYSTRSDSNTCDAPSAILKGLAQDGGLFTLKEVPQFDLESLQNLDFISLSSTILSQYLDSYPKDVIQDCVESAYKQNFDTKEITPLKCLKDFSILELYHGPTAAFKDVALCLLPHLLLASLKQKNLNKTIVILTATSGDTGSAALSGFSNVPNTKALAFFPNNGISEIQRAQMTTLEANNVLACAIDGNFDQAQTGVKNIFANIKETDSLMFSSANSINFGRLAPQIVYYFKSYFDLVKTQKIKVGDKVNFCVPTGNFGDILAGFYAKLSGLPINKLICASNDNKVLTDFFETGHYNKNRDFVITTSPSMDILVSSNLERLLYYSLDFDSNQVSQKMQELKEKGSYQMPQKAMDKIRETFCSYWVSQEEAKQTIKEVYEKENYLIDPHTAVAYKAALNFKSDSKFLEDSKYQTIVLSTASAFKFPKSVLEAIDLKPVSPSAKDQLERLCSLTKAQPPKCLQNILNKEERFKDVIDPSKMMDYVLTKEVNND